MATPGLITSVERTSHKCIALNMSMRAVGDHQWFVLMSDLHFDNAHCDRDLLREHLEWAKANDAAVVLLGDIHCAMQAKYDKRSDRSQLRDEYQSGPYFDRLVSEFDRFAFPYARNIVAVTPGNHEASVADRNETDLTERTVHCLRENGSSALKGTYQGWFWIRASLHTTKRYSMAWAYTHGYGGGGPVTKDTIQFNRQQAYLDGADAILSGHTHDAWCVPSMHVHLDRHGVEKRRTTWGLKLGTYKDEFGCGQGWAVGKGHPPKPLGCVRLKVVATSDGIRIEEASPMLK